MRSFIPFVVALAWLGACNGQTQAEREQAHQDSVRTAAVDSVAMASAAFDSTVFDTITWKKKGDDIDRGSLVYNVSCARCHGQDGAGVKNIIFRGDTLNPPSFLTPDWALAKDPMGLRKKIFTGDVQGMPHFGVIGLHYRDADAVARFIVNSLRPRNMPKNTSK